MPLVTFLPSNVQVEISREENILKAAIKAGLHINASCAGTGVCNKCLVYLEEGEVKGQRLPDGGWKACDTFPETDVKIRIPVQSQMDKKTLSRALPRKATRWIQSHSGISQIRPKPVVEKLEIKLPSPTLSDSVSDLERLQREIKQGRLQDITLEVDAQTLYGLPLALRNSNWDITVSLMEGIRHDIRRLIRIEDGKKKHEHAGVAIDIGTTTVSAQLLNLHTGEILSEASDYNPQVSYGEDVISRVEFARKGDGLNMLKEKIVRCLDNLIDDITQKVSCKKESISIVSIAANTVMCHLLLGLNPHYLRAEPYTPVAVEFPPVRAKELGMNLSEHVRIFLAPCVASYVGGDIVAGVVGIEMHKMPELTLFIDIGTNGEIVLGNQDWMACAACSAGPAFEGGGIQHGMRATTGAIEVVHIQPETLEPMSMTIGKKKAKGICGSGIISLLAGLFMTGALDQRGKYRRDTGSPRIREGRDGWEYLLVNADATSIGQDIVFTEADVENLIRAKGAMFAGYLTLLESVGMSVNELERVILAGNFGSYLDLEQAITIGLLPDIPREKFFFAGNSSLIGARAGLLSWEVNRKFVEIGSMMTHFDLANSPGFMEHYVSSMFLPHTDMSLFPSVKLG